MTQPYRQTPLPGFDTPVSEAVNGAITNSDNTIAADDRAFHDWYRFVLSYPPHLVRDYLRDFGLRSGSVVLDPFCGTGTTLVEAKLNGIAALGIEANPFPQFACAVKLDWQIAPAELMALADQVGAATLEELARQGIDDGTPISAPHDNLRQLDAKASRTIIKDSISPLPLHKTLVLRDQLEQHKDTPAYRYGLLALGNALVTDIGNLRFGPEVGVGRLKADAPVVALWRNRLAQMAADLAQLKTGAYPQATVHLGDARHLQRLIAPCSVDAVITSPPYPNEKDYSRTTRLESVVLGFYEDMAQLRTHKRRLLRSNTRGVYTTDSDDQWVTHLASVQQVADEIEARRLALGKTSGFEKLYARVTRLYFGGMAKHLHDLTAVLKPGAQLAYVVGDQASYLRVMIRTGQLLAEIAEDIGYKVERIDLFRTRFATATRAELREEVVVLSWPGR